MWPARRRPGSIGASAAFGPIWERDAARRKGCRRDAARRLATDRGRSMTLAGFRLLPGHLGRGRATTAQAAEVLAAADARARSIGR